MGQKDEIILININGTDRPGVTAALTEILAKNNAVILDIGQADIHNNLSLGILFQSSEGNSGDILKELLFKSYELDVNIRFNPITEEAYNQWVSMQGKNRYIITILGRKLTARQIAGVTRIVADQDMNIDDIKRLTGRIPLDENARTPKASVEFSVRGTPRDKEQMKADFMKLSAEQEMDISISCSAESFMKSAFICSLSLGVPRTENSTLAFGVRAFSSKGIRPVKRLMSSMFMSWSATMRVTPAICRAVSFRPRIVIIYRFLPCMETHWL